MGLKAKIKNDMWYINYIIPFTAKYLQYGKLGYIKRALPVIAKLKVIKGNGTRDISKDIIALMQKIDLNMNKESSFIYWIDEYKTVAVKGNVLSNFSIDYERLVNGCFDSVADRAIAVGGIYGERANNIKTAIHVLRDREIKVVQETDIATQDKERLLDELRSLLEKPATHFHEGLQRVLFFNQYMWQTRHGLNGFGRLDKILGKLYESDIKSGVLNREEAYSMVYDFLNSVSKWYEYKSSSLLGDIGQIVIVSGLEKDGSYFSNDLSYFFLKAQSELKKPDPKTLIRVSKNMPDELLEAAVEALKTKTGSPLFSNDDTVIPMLRQFGMAEEDIYSYCVSACWEPFIPGKSLDQNNIKAFDFFRPLDMALNENDLSKVSDFEALLSMYEQTLTREWKVFLESLDEYKWACDPFVSMMTDGCNENATDISLGGAVYNNYGVTSIGMGSACDTLLNIKELVFEKKLYGLSHLNEKRKADFADSDDLYNEINILKHHYGHDEDEVVALTNRIINHSNKVVKEYINPLSGRAKFGLSSPFYLRDAKNAPADLAGRRQGDPYGTHISCLDASHTEIVNFAAKLNYDGHAFNGNVIDYFISSSLIEDNYEKFVAFMKAAIKVGYFQMQLNIMDSATLIDAKSHPEKYPGLIVRVWGFSAYFNDLPEEYKDMLIKRALESEKSA